jgi:DNA-binding winged helix-turn-helix (wHTH) protein/tetratricopeptide (TPR) repeat protein
VFRFSGFELDKGRAELRGPNGDVIKLRSRSFEMLKFFTANAGQVVSKQDLMNAVWPGVHVSEDSLFQTIRELRAALGDDDRQMIKLMSGRGYQFVAAVSEIPLSSLGPIEIGRPAPSLPEAEAPSQTNSDPAKPRPGFNVLTRRAVLAGVAAVIVIGILAAVTLRPGPATERESVTIAMVPLTESSGDPVAAQMSTNVSNRLTDGLAKIANVHVLLSDEVRDKADFVVSGDLQKSDQSWTVRARMTARDTGEIRWTKSYTVSRTESPDLELQQTRLAAGVGHDLALRINELTNADPVAASRDSLANSESKVVIEQATAYINQTSLERFQAAQAMLEKALASNADADNVDIEIALAALLMRGVQMDWLKAADREAAETKAGALLQQILRTRPRYIPAHEAYCRYLNAINEFSASLVACAKALTFDPWNGIALYHIGLAQIQSGRFEDTLATFKQADRFDTPQVSRWTWMIGAGWANLMMDRAEDAIPWLQKSIAITPASGRTHMLLAAAYERLGRHDEAQAAMAKGLQLRPGSTALNVPPPKKNASSIYLEASERSMQAMIAAGLPRS